MSIQPVVQQTFGFFHHLPVVVEASQAELSSDGGLLPVREFDERIGLTRAFTAALDDPRDRRHIDHPLEEMVRARVYGILAGYEDQNDHDVLRTDPVFKLVAGRYPTQEQLESKTNQ